MTDRLYDALESCLQALEGGQTIDSALEHYPELAPELRPILEVSLQARTLKTASIPEGVQRRGRARLLQRAAQLRQSQRLSSRHSLAFFPRLALALGAAAALILSSTGLVGASSNSLPGDQLYPVKRTWEGFQLALMLNRQGQEALQSRFEQERLNEIDELLIRNRSQAVTFSGLVTGRQDGAWLVSGIRVVVTNRTRFSAAPIANGVPVTVTGTTGSDGGLQADEIQSLQPGSLLPPLEPSDKHATEGPIPSNALGAQTPSPAPMETPPAPAATPRSFSFTGIVQNEQGATWTINGQAVSVEPAAITGAIGVGGAVKFDGYYGDDGSFIVTSIESDPPGNSSHGGGSKNPNSGKNPNNGHEHNGGGDNEGGGGDG
ncbi:MAG TPA: DUF5667 domain-containing protein [Anaerolineales bacterium]|nr:DUF5667 domain-containing protein [Anaerolineales bacterium]